MLQFCHGGEHIRTGGTAGVDCVHGLSENAWCLGADGVAKRSWTINLGSTP